MQTTYGGLDILVNNAAIAFKGRDPTPFAQQVSCLSFYSFSLSLSLSLSRVCVRARACANLCKACVLRGRVWGEEAE